MSALTQQEAHEFLVSAVVILERLEDLERPPRYAVPRDTMNCGETMVLLGALVALIAEHYPATVTEVDHAIDLASRNFRREH